VQLNGRTLNLMTDGVHGDYAVLVSSISGLYDQILISPCRPEGLIKGIDRLTISYTPAVTQNGLEPKQTGPVGLYTGGPGGW
jgi:hypothetical protein